MVNYKDYIELKKIIKYECRPNIIDLCDKMGLNDFEKRLLLDFYDGKTRTESCFRFNICESTYTNKMRLLFTKIAKYINYKSTK